MVKIAVGYPDGSVYELFISLIVLILSTVVMLSVSARLYKNGILQFGHRLTIRHILNGLGVHDKLAVIDLGTNTFNLLIAAKTASGFDILHSEKVGVALGMGGINDRRISGDAFGRGSKHWFISKKNALLYRLTGSGLLGLQR